MQTFFGLFSPIFAKHLQIKVCEKIKDMDNVRLNTMLLKNLSDILGMPVMKILDATGIVVSTWYNIQQHTEMISVQQLLAIANGLHIPVRRFFMETSSRVKVVGCREDYVVYPYMECYYDAAKLNYFVEAQQSSWQKVADDMGKNKQRLCESLLSYRRTPLNRFLEVCHLLGINPFDVLIDPNPEAARKPVSTKAQKSLGQVEMEVNDLKTKMRTQQQTIDDLQEKLDNLMTAHKMLLNRFNNHVMGGVGTMAAEDIGEG